jgi:nucleoid-associated protein YgaU
LAFFDRMDYTAFKAYTENGYVLRNPGPRFLLTLLIITLGAAAPARAELVPLKADHPERYTVVRGDTLWGIAGRFLKNPWDWPRIWKLNEGIKNPHLIYPGDAIVLRYVDGKPELTVLRNEKPAAGEAAAEPGATATARPTVKLGPRIHSEPLETAVPTIPPNVIAPFLTQPLVVNETELQAAGYVTTGLDGRIALGNMSEFYARGLKDASPEFYQVFRRGKPIRHPDHPEDILGYEAVYLGDAKRLEAGDPVKLVVTRARQEIIPGDRLLAMSGKTALPYYHPRPPKTRVEGKILSALSDVATAEMGPYTVVAINLGTREGLEEGNVLRVMRHVGTHKDPVTRESYRLPDEESALIMVFRTFEKLSYALVMSATRPVHVRDKVVSP